MMRLVATLLALLLVAAPAGAAETIFPPGSRMGLVPPPDMQIARGLSGFRSTRTGAGIVFIEMPPTAFPGLSASLSDDGLKAQGFRLKSRETVKVGSAPATLITGEQVDGQRSTAKVMLVAADPTLTGLAMGQLPENASAEDLAALQAALRTVAIRPPLSLDEQVAGLSFGISDRAGFRPVRALAGNALLLTDGPQDVIQNASQPVMIVAESFGPPPTSNFRDTFARQAFASNNFVKDPVLERAQSYRQGGNDWHEIVAKATEAGSGVPVIITQTIRFENDSYIRAIGIVKADGRDAVLPRFRKLTDSLTSR